MGIKSEKFALPVSLKHRLVVLELFLCRVWRNKGIGVQHDLTRPQDLKDVNARVGAVALDFARAHVITVCIGAHAAADHLGWIQVWRETARFADAE
jgi:hypothetical protein